MKPVEALYNKLLLFTPLVSAIVLSDTQSLPLEGLGHPSSKIFFRKSHVDNMAESWEVFLQALDVSFIGPHALCIKLFYF
jgi:hypothetical protein